MDTFKIQHDGLWCSDVVCQKTIFSKIIFAKFFFWKKNFLKSQLTLDPLTFLFLRIIHSNVAKLSSYVQSQIVPKTMVHWNVWDAQWLHTSKSDVFCQNWKNKNSTKLWHFPPLDVYLSSFQYWSNQKLQHCCRVFNLETCQKCRSMDKINEHVHVVGCATSSHFLIVFDHFWSFFHQFLYQQSIKLVL